jgi:predicted PhzF superfamily epimerase YddE/YHI9
MITARSAASGYDFVSRFFAPAVGINEDPATGSAHCCLAPFWQARLGKTAFLARQLSSRGATIKVRVEGDRVKLAGQAVTMMKGEFTA